MDYYRSFGIFAGVLGIVIIAVAWLNTPAVLGSLDPTIGGYSRMTVILVSAGLIAIAAGTASYLMAKPSI